MKRLKLITPLWLLLFSSCDLHDSVQSMQDWINEDFHRSDLIIVSNQTGLSLDIYARTIFGGDTLMTREILGNGYNLELFTKDTINPAY